MDYEKAYKNIFSYIRTLEKIACKDKSPLINESLAMMYDLVKKSTPMPLNYGVLKGNTVVTANCPRCKKSVVEGVKMCHNCGQKLKWNYE